MFERMTYYTVKQAARRTGVPDSLILQLCQEGVIEAVHLSGNDYRITSTELENIEEAGLLKGYVDEDEDD
jgi:excisionase family DNA binding protein